MLTLNYFRSIKIRISLVIFAVVAVVAVVVAEGASVAEPGLGRSAAEQKNGRDRDDQDEIPA
jgi:hypothetical protein